MLLKPFKKVSQKLSLSVLQDAQETLKEQLLEAAKVLDLDKGVVEAATGNASALCGLACEVAERLDVVGQALPLASNIIKTTESVREISEHLQQREYGKAAAATGAGAAEGAGSIVGFGAGDLAREVVRETIIRTAGENYAPEKSGLRELGEELAPKIKKLKPRKPAAKKSAPKK